MEQPKDGRTFSAEEGTCQGQGVFGCSDKLMKGDAPIRSFRGELVNLIRDEHLELSFDVLGDILGKRPPSPGELE
jgi:hypothetical protein